MTRGTLADAFARARSIDVKRPALAGCRRQRLRAPERLSAVIGAASGRSRPPAPPGSRCGTRLHGLALNLCAGRSARCGDLARGTIISGVRTTYLVCYDISNDLRLRRVHKTMVGFGDRLQYSVFECRFTAADFARCRHALSKIIHHREDQVLFVDLGPADARGERVISSIGRAYSTLNSPCIVVDREEDAGELLGTKRKVDALRRARRRRSGDMPENGDYE